MTFVEYCMDKSIDANAFEKHEKALFDSLSKYFNELHPNSFTAQKLFIINDIRRRYHFEKPKVEKKKHNSAKSKVAIPGQKISMPRPGVINKPKRDEKREGDYIGEKKVVVKTKVAGVRKNAPLRPVVKKKKSGITDSVGDSELKVSKKVIKSPVLNLNIPNKKKDE